MSCLILLDNYQGPYYAGDDVIGRVVCSFNESKNIKCIELKMKGWENNDWKRRSGKRIVSYSGYNEFLYVTNILHVGGDIGPGSFEFPFNLQLPYNIPSTYNGHHGGISFLLRAAVDIPSSTDYTDKKEIVVISPINFNLMKDQLLLKPVSYSNDEIVYCCCWTSGYITMNVRLEKTAFVAGEVVNVKLDVHNMSSERVQWVSVLLCMYITSMVSCPYESKCDIQLLAADGASGVQAHSQKSYSFNLKIPKSAEVPNFASCNLFSQRTTLKVNARIPNFHSNMDIELDITMGHIPVEHRSVPGERYTSNTSLRCTDPPGPHLPNTIMVPYAPAQGSISGSGEQYHSNTSLPSIDPPSSQLPNPLMPPYPPTQGSISSPGEQHPFNTSLPTAPPSLHSSDPMMPPYPLTQSSISSPGEQYPFNTFLPTAPPSLHSSEPMNLPYPPTLGPGEQYPSNTSLPSTDLPSPHPLKAIVPPYPPPQGSISNPIGFVMLPRAESRLNASSPESYV